MKLYASLFLLNSLPLLAVIIIYISHIMEVSNNQNASVTYSNSYIVYLVILILVILLLIAYVIRRAFNFSKLKNYEFNTGQAIGLGILIIGSIALLATGYFIYIEYTNKSLSSAAPWGFLISYPVSTAGIILFELSYLIRIVFKKSFQPTIKTDR